MIVAQEYGAHSAQVEMWLIIGSEMITVNQMGDDFLLIENAGSYPPSKATVVLQVDASERRWDVYLPDGIHPGRARVSVSNPGGK